MAISKRIDDNTMMRIHESFLKHRKKAVILIVLGLILISIVAGYVWMSYRTWQSSEQTYVSRKTDVISLADSILYNGDSSNEDRQKKLQQLSSLSITDLCKIAPLYNWQRSFIGSLEAKIKDCESGRSRIETVIARANNLQRYSSDETKITQQLQKLKPMKDTISSVEIQKMLDTITKIQTNITQASLVSTDGKELRTLSSDILTATSDSWRALMAASEKQDRAGYEAEMIKLAGIYDRFAEISTLSINQYQALLGSLETGFSTISK